MELNINFEPFLHAVEPWLVYFYLCSWVESRMLSRIDQEVLKALPYLKWCLKVIAYSITWITVLIFSWFWFKLPVEVFHLPVLSFEQCCMFFILMEFTFLPLHRSDTRMEMTPELKKTVEDLNKLFPKKVKK